MELDLLGVVVQEEGEEALVGWEVTDPGQVPVGIVSALIAGPDYPIR